MLADMLYNWEASAHYLPFTTELLVLIMLAGILLSACVDVVLLFFLRFEFPLQTIFFYLFI